MIEGNGGGASGFADLTLAPELCHVLSGLGYEEPTPIQLAAIPPLLEGRDLVGQAATGTGKTAAFALPILHRILGEGGQAEPLALVRAPHQVQRSPAQPREDQRPVGGQRAVDRCRGESFRDGADGKPRAE